MGIAGNTLFNGTNLALARYLSVSIVLFFQRPANNLQFLVFLIKESDSPSHWIALFLDIICWMPLICSSVRGGKLGNCYGRNSPLLDICASTYKQFLSTSTPMQMFWFSSMNWSNIPPSFFPGFRIVNLLIF